MGMSIQVNDFQWEPGKNDAEYIKLLKSSRDEWQRIAQKAIAKLKMLSKSQEPVKPKGVIYDDEHMSVYCPSCDNRLAGLTHDGTVALETEETPNYCWMCGQAVKW